MPTIDQLCQDIASLSRKITSKETDLKNYTQDLKMLTTRRASLQTQVTKKQ
jgi:septal ring factor EnvC (AmiA/AmiB activator)